MKKRNDRGEERPGLPYLRRHGGFARKVSKLYLSPVSRTLVWNEHPALVACAQPAVPRSLPLRGLRDHFFYTAIPVSSSSSSSSSWSRGALHSFSKSPGTLALADADPRDSRIFLFFYFYSCHFYISSLYVSLGSIRRYTSSPNLPHQLYLRKSCANSHLHAFIVGYLRAHNNRGYDDSIISVDIKCNYWLWKYSEIFYRK